MGRLKITDFFLYRNRYVASYSLIGFILVALLFVSGVLVPGGISDLEMTSAAQSSNTTSAALIGNQNESIINLPYRFMQALSFSIFGISILSIKLPSLILAAASILLLYGTLELWFRRNVAIITSIITMTSSQFLLQSQSGTAGIIYMFWGALLLFCASTLASSKRYRPIWLMLTALVAGLSLYTPYMLYATIPLIIAACIHPHARFVVFRQPIWALCVSVLLFAVALVPLVISSLNDSTMLLSVLAGQAISSGTLDITSNISQLSQYVDFFNNRGGRVLQPAFGLGLLLLAVVGAAHLLSAKYTAKSYIMAIWVVLTIPILIINPDAAGAAILPISLLSAFAIDFLIRRWYTMFPHNPYARVTGLFPLGILVLVLSISSMDRFIYGYRYDSDAAKAYSSDIRLLREEIDTHRRQHINLIVPAKDQSFYEAFITRNHLTKNVTLTTSQVNTAKDQVVIMSGQIHKPLSNNTRLVKIIVSQKSRDANRFYVYENKAS
jgi:hypothetical protein